jgi:hypothetical protein
VKHVSVRAQSSSLKQVAETAGIDKRGLSRSYVHRLGAKVVQETAEMARESIKAEQGSNMFLYYDGKIIKE